MITYLSLYDITGGGGGGGWIAFRCNLLGARWVCLGVCVGCQLAKREGEGWGHPAWQQTYRRDSVSVSVCVCAQTKGERAYKYLKYLKINIDIWI